MELATVWATAWILLVIGTVRELLAAGTLLGRTILPLVDNGGWFTPLQLAALPPGAFFLLGGLVWAVRSLRPEQQEVLPVTTDEESPS